MGKMLGSVIVLVALAGLASTDLGNQGWISSASMAGVNFQEGNADVLLDQVGAVVSANGEYRVTSRQMEQAKELARRVLCEYKRTGTVDVDSMVSEWEASRD